MKTIGIILIILQVIGLFGSLVNGSLIEMLHITNAVDISELVGYFCLLYWVFSFIQREEKRRIQNKRTNYLIIILKTKNIIERVGNQCVFICIINTKNILFLKS